MLATRSEVSQEPRIPLATASDRTVYQLNTRKEFYVVAEIENAVPQANFLQ